MILSDSHISELRQLAESSALAAGKIIQDACPESIKIELKTGATELAAQVVTEIDLASERLIYQMLSPTFERLDIAFLGEESDDDGMRHTCDYFWCVDPLDGTLAFTQQVPGYAVSIALVTKIGKPVIGVIYDPLNGILYSSAQHQGVLRNGQPFIRPLASKQFTLPCDRSLVARSDFEQLVNHFEEWAQSQRLEGISYVHEAGAVMNAIWALENPPSCYFKIPKAERGGGSLWDFAATACIYEEFGAEVCGFDGQKLDLNTKGSTFMNSRGVIYASEKEVVALVQDCVLAGGNLK